MTTVRQGVVAVIGRPDRRLLVIQRSELVTAPGAYCFPGGAIEPGESETDALRRELDEELGLAIRPLRRLWRSRTPWNVELAWWSAELEAPDAQPQPAPAEVARADWMEVAAIRRLPKLLTSNLEFFAAWDAGEFELPWTTSDRRA